MYVPALTGETLTAQYGELVALLDMDEARVRAFAEREQLDVPAYSPDQFSRMVRETRPEAVIVTTPDGTHVDYIVQALEHDLNVITEKPMVIDSQQARRVFAAEAQSKGTVRVTHNYRYTQPHMQIKRMIQNDMIGRITNVELVWNIDTYHGSSYFYRWNRDREKSGGMSITKGCHHFDLLNWWIGDQPAEVFSFGALNYYGAKSPWNPSLIDGEAYSPLEQRARCAYNRHWQSDPATAPVDDHLKPTDRRFKLPNERQYPKGQPIYIYDEDIAIEDTYSAVIRYRGGASVSYSANFSAPWEGYTLAINGTKGRLESTHYTSPSRCPFPASDRQPITYYPMFGERQIHETRVLPGGHGGGDPLILRNLFVETTPENTELGLNATSLDGAYAVAVGEAVWRSVEEKRVIDIEALLQRDQPAG
jgi:predicted dehydrogenase